MSNWVHECAYTYREIVKAMSFPGRIVDISGFYGDNPFNGDIDHQTLLLAVLLLDTEVKFFVEEDDRKLITNAIIKMTGAIPSSVEDADYIFIDKTTQSDRLKYIIANAKIGDLIDPHHSATVIYRMSNLASGQRYQLSGPGIQSTKDAVLDVLSDVIEVRNDRVVEFPMGLDMLLVSDTGQLLALPRTTVVEVV